MTIQIFDKQFGRSNDIELVTDYSLSSDNKVLTMNTRMGKIIYFLDSVTKITIIGAEAE